MGEEVNKNPPQTTLWHCTVLHFLYVLMFIFCIFTGLNEVSPFTFKKKKKKKPSSEGNFQNQVIFFLPAKHAAYFGRVLRKSSVCTELKGRSKNRETHRRETEVRVSRALGRAFLLHKCFEAEAPNPWALPSSSGWDARAPGR